MAAFFQISTVLLALTSAALSVPVEYEGQHYQHYAPALLKVAHAPIAVKTVEVEHYAPPHYEFKYGVKDEHTGDIKEQAEKREGDRVEGYYSLVEPDGTTRTVHYSSDKHTGFQAQVHKSGHAVHPAHVPVVKKVVVPAVKKVVAPVVTYSHAAPVYSHAAPAYSHAAPVYSHAAPVYSHAAPVYSHSVPVYSHASYH